MDKILLIISFLRTSQKTINEAIELARQRNSELVVSFVVDVEYADKIAGRLTDDGWIGMKPSERLYESLLQEYEFQAIAKIADIEEKTKEFDIPTRSIIRHGAVLEQTLKIAEQENPDLIVITRRKRSNLSRQIFGSLVQSLKNQVKCEVKVIDAEPE